MKIKPKKDRHVSFRISGEEEALLNLLARSKGIPSIHTLAKELMFLGIETLERESGAGNAPAGEPGAGIDPAALEELRGQLAALQAGQDKVRRHVDAQTYVMLYHMLPIHADHKQEQERSAWERFHKFKEIAEKIDHAPPAIKR